MKIYINRENQKKCGPICKNSVIYIKNPIILLIIIINNCTLSHQCFFFFSFENDSTKHRSAQSINQFKFEGLTKKNTNLTKIYQTKTKFNQYNNRTKQKSRNCKNKWEIREKGSQTFWIFFFPLSVGLEQNMQTVKKGSDAAYFTISE